MLVLIGLLLYYNYEIYEANTIILILMYSMSKIGILGALTSSISINISFRCGLGWERVYKHGKNQLIFENWWWIRVKSIIFLKKLKIYIRKQNQSL